ncbi:MAG: ISL3 family transposase [Anaerolineae bacterium]|nr:ISL3 family transposase [Anaerolineae bacterium]
MAKTIVATEDDIDQYRSLTETLQLQDLCVVGQEFDPDLNRLILVCVPRWPVSVCPDCGQVCSQVHDYPKQRAIRDTPIRGCQTVLLFDSRRFDCEQCQSSFTEPIRDVVPDCTYTYRLMAELADPRRKQDVATLAATYGLGYKLVESILLKAAQAKVEARTQAPLQVKQLGIDEISNRKGQGDYVLVLTDLQRRILLDILPDRKQQSLIDWLRRPPAGIDLSQLATVAIDLWAHYRQAVQTVYPDVIIVADRFHVVQNLNEAIHKIRREFQRQASSDAERSQLKGLRYLLIKNQAKLTPTEQARLAQLEQTQPVLYQVWHLRQRLHDWYETNTTPELAQPDLQHWIADATALGLTHLDNFCQTLTNWQPEIVNFFRTVSPVALSRG